MKSAVNIDGIHDGVNVSRSARRFKTGAAAVVNIMQQFTLL